MQLRYHVAMKFAVLLVLGSTLVGGSPATVAAKNKLDKHTFDMVVATGAAGCLPFAQGHVTIEPEGDNQKMKVDVEGLAPDTTFTLFVLQVPTGPFGMSWYQGDITTNHDGRGHKEFLGIFSTETFIHAQAVHDAPQTHPGVDALTNPVTAPVHMYHLGMWFDDPNAANAVRCPNGTTPFNGDHTAGIQVLNTSNAGTAAEDGPLGQVN